MRHTMRLWALVHQKTSNWWTTKTKSKGIPKTFKEWLEQIRTGNKMLKWLPGRGGSKDKTTWLRLEEMDIYTRKEKSLTKWKFIFCKNLNILKLLFDISSDIRRRFLHETNKNGQNTDLCGTSSQFIKLRTHCPQTFFSRILKHFPQNGSKFRDEKVRNSVSKAFNLLLMTIQYFKSL